MALDEKTGNYYYQNSNKKIGIGAFPLRPDNSEDTLRKQIKKWLNDEDGRQMLLQMSIPQKGLEYVDEHDGKGPYFLSIIDPHVNPDVEAIIQGKATSFVSGYSTIYAGIDFQQIRYFAPVIEHYVHGFYKVKKASYGVIDASETLQRNKESKNVKSYKGYDKPFRIRIELEEYKALSIPFKYGLPDALRGTSIKDKKFKDYCNRAKPTL